MIDVRDASFTYPRAERPALNAVSFKLAPGITGLIGPNGAGKSTLLRILAGFATPQRGSVSINGAPPAEVRAARRLGITPEIPQLEPWLTVDEFLSGLANITARADTVEAAGADISRHRMATLSLGQRRRVELAAAMTGDPLLLLLDEPTNGLDPDAVQLLRASLQSTRRGDRYIIVSSHHLDELQRTVDQVVLLREGACVGFWTSHDVTEQFGTFDNLFAFSRTAETT